MDKKNSKNSTIGIFDSGVGGLSVWRELIKVLPGNRMIYVSDNAYSPYGPRPQSEIVSRAVEINGSINRSAQRVIQHTLYWYGTGSKTGLLLTPELE